MLLLFVCLINSSFFLISLLAIKCFLSWVIFLWHYLLILFSFVHPLWNDCFHWRPFSAQGNIWTFIMDELKHTSQSLKLSNNKLVHMHKNIFCADVLLLLMLVFFVQILQELNYVDGQMVNIWTQTLFSTSVTSAKSSDGWMNRWTNMKCCVIGTKSVLMNSAYFVMQHMRLNLLCHTGEWLFKCAFAFV